MCGQKWCGELLVEGEEELDALAVAGEGLGAVATLNGAVEPLVGVNEFCGHGKRIVELGERGVGIERASVEDGLCKLFDFDLLGRSRILRPWKIVVDEGVGVTKIGLETTRHEPDPSHMHG